MTLPPAAAAQQPPSFALLLLASLLYLATAAWIFFAVIDSRRNPARNSRAFAHHWRRDDRFWIAIGSILVLIAVYRVTGLEFWLQNQLRTLLRVDDMYADRHELQAPAVVGALVASVTVLGVISVRLRRRHPAILVAAVSGLALLLSIALRAISLHAFDALLHASIAGIRLGWLAEAGPLMLLAGSAFWFRRWRATLRPPSRSGGGREQAG